MTGRAAPPRATYRLQFNKDFTFRDATGLVPYLAELGISHVYASPFLQARPGSTHGYDITDHNRINPEIGTEEEFRALVASLHDRGMGLILDFVPNHMGIGAGNSWWLDVLEWGENSPYAAFFDIDWEASRPDTRGKVLLPVLGDQYGAILTKGEIALRFDAGEGSISAWYFDHRFPIAPIEYHELLRRAEVPDDAADEFSGILDDLTMIAADARRRWRPGIHDQAGALQRDLAALATARPGLAEAIGAALATTSGVPGHRPSWQALHALLERQAYRLAYWRVAADEINYRRFFNINDLAGLRVELPELFEQMHGLVFRLIAEGSIDGLRIDHIDGLFDPREYCERLQARHAELRGTEAGPLYVVVEKILAHGEELPDWPVAGTTGYEFTNQAMGVLVDPEGRVPLARLDRRFTGRTKDFDEILWESKQRIMQVNLASEMNVLAHEFHRLSAGDWRSRDFTLNGMREALEEVIAAFPVYRTYVARRGAGPVDRQHIDQAIDAAKRHSTAADPSIFELLRRILGGELGGRSGWYNRAEVLRLAMKFQQVTGPVMAKGLEDTSFYRYFRLIALNEVGGDPRLFGLPVDEFHAANRRRAESWPGTLLTTATHDTKRGEDARMRIAVLAELPAEWGRQVAAWVRLNRPLRKAAERDSSIHSSHEYLFYQALLGAWPIGLRHDDAPGLAALAERMVAYMEKAVREGKDLSGWANPNIAYEEGVIAFVRGVLDAGRSAGFIDDFADFIQRIARFGAVNGLAQTLLKLASPGVPDTYQGTEFWDFSLVDPDNRRPVDWAARRVLLADLRARYGAERLAPEILAELRRSWVDGREKLFLLWRALRFRREVPALFAEGDYAGIAAEGPAASHAVAFIRSHEGRRIVAVAPRRAARLEEAGGWGETRLRLPAAAGWRDVLTGAEHGGTPRLADLLRGFPVALLAAI